MNMFLEEGLGDRKVTKALLGFVVILLAWMIVPRHMPSALAQEPTPFPQSDILSPEEWAEILQPSESCEIPCFLGVFPGVTTVVEVEDLIMSNFGPVPSNRYNINDNRRGSTFGLGVVDINSEITLSDNYHEPYLRVTFVSYQDIIQSIYFYPSTIADLEYDSFEYFDALNLLDTYGTPDTVRASVGPVEGTQRIGIISALYLSWEEENLATAYTKEPGSENNPFCMTIDHVDGIFVGFQGDDRTLSMDEFMYEQQQWDTSTRALSRLSSLSKGEFLQEFIEHDGCFIPEMFDLIP